MPTADQALGFCTLEVVAVLHSCSSQVKQVIVFGFKQDVAREVVAGTGSRVLYIGHMICRLCNVREQECLQQRFKAI